MCTFEFNTFLPLECCVRASQLLLMALHFSCSSQARRVRVFKRANTMPTEMTSVPSSEGDYLSLSLSSRDLRANAPIHEEENVYEDGTTIRQWFSFDNESICMIISCLISAQKCLTQSISNSDQGMPLILALV